MSINQTTFELGFHTLNTFLQGEKVNRNATSVVPYNLLTISGYIPVIGLLAGAFRINSNVDNKDVSLGLRIVSITRGVFEFLGLGILFLIPDIIVTIGRHCTCGTSTPNLKGRATATVTMGQPQ